MWANDESLTGMSTGCRVLDVAGPLVDDSFPMVVMYPSRSPERRERLGPYFMEVAMNAPIDGGSHTLVMISHGSGGSHLVYRTLAKSLAREGFVVGQPKHPRNSRDDNSLVGSFTLLEQRPRELQAAIDCIENDPQLGPHLVRDTVAVIGHSMGGYTALALAGGRPIAGPHETSDQQPRMVHIEHDARVKALVLLAPATPWFRAPGALRNVRVPILLRSAEKDLQAPAWFSEIVTRGVPEKRVVEHLVVPNAGHFSFLSPFPPEMTKPEFPPSQDPPGFDREQFLIQLSADIVAFLHRVL